jgi:hypothetical protein
MPLQNLGDMAFIFGKHKEAMIFDDISLKVLGGHDPGNELKYKIVSQLASILDFLG